MSQILYKKICDNNRIEYGTKFERVLKIIINQYSDRTHFIYELLQNAEDAEASHIQFQLDKNRLVIYHNGRPFNEKDIKGVCGIAEGTKDDGTRIGHFGIGFKSVYCYTEKPYIYSGEHRFAIVNRLFPEEINEMPGLAYDETCMVLPFDKEDVPSEMAYQEIRNALLKKINAESLLMLKNIENVEIRIADYTEKIQISKLRFQLDEANHPDNVFSLSVQTTYKNLVTGKERHNDADYLFFTDANERATAVIFGVDGRELKAIRNSRIYAFFPTAKESHQGFYIHAPFDTTPARDNFKEGAEYGKHNIELVNNLGQLIWFAFNWMRDHNYLSVKGFCSVFPVYQYEEDDVLFGIYQNSIEMIEQEAIIPTSVPGEFKRISEICVPLWGNIIDVFGVHDLRRLMRRPNINWIAKEYTTEAYADIRAFFNKNFRIDTIEWKDLVLKMDAAFLREKELSWMDQMMEKVESYCIRKSTSDGHYIDASRLPLVRITSGEQISARDEAGRLLVYLNNPDIAKYRIESAFLKNDTVRRFYQRILEIPEYNVEQEAIENVLPKYETRTPAFKGADPLRENIEDLKVIKEAIYKNPSIVDRVKDKHIVSDGTGWYKPSEIYIPSDDSRTGYSLVKGILPIRYLADGYMNDSLAVLKLDMDFWKRIGCNTRLKGRNVSREEYLDAVQRYCGIQMRRELSLKVFRKTYISSKMNWDFTFEGFPAVFQNITEKKSLAIARFLNLYTESFSIHDNLVGADDQHFSGKNVDSMHAYSMLGLHLCFTKWIYKQDDPNPYYPGEVDISEIQPEYQKVAKRLLAILPFKEEKSAISEFVDSSFSNQSDRDLVKVLLNNKDDLLQAAKVIAKNKTKDGGRKGPSLIDLIGSGDVPQTEFGVPSDTDIVPMSSNAIHRRETKLDKEFAETLENKFTITRSLSFGRRESTKEEKEFLSAQYNGVCQICGKYITNYKGEPYFEAINIIRTSDLDDRIRPSLRRGWNSLCLCPNCAAEYKYCSKKISTLYEQVQNTRVMAGSDEPVQITIELPMGEKKQIRYTPQHFIALQSAFKIFGEE